MPELKTMRLSLASAALLLPLLAACGEEGQETATDSPGAGGSTTECSFTSDGREPSRDVEAPEASTDLAGEVPATIETSSGTIGVTLDADAAPCTVHSFVSLAEQGYFDDTECHRLTTSGIYVLQCGDPTATGTGGPGYTVPDELDRAEDGYPAGVLAMANTGAPDSGGSQFFIVHEDTELPPSYAVFGEIDAAGLEVVQGIAADGTDTGAPDGPPADEVTITSVTTG